MSTTRPTLITPYDRLIQRAKDAEAAKLHGPQCFDGALLICGWPELHVAKKQATA